MSIFEQSRYYFNYVLPNVITLNAIQMNEFLSRYWWIFVIFVVIFSVAALKLFRKNIELRVQFKKFDDFVHELSSKREVKDIESFLLTSTKLVGAKYSAMYALRGETYILMDSSVEAGGSIATPLRLAKQELKRFKKSGNYGIDFFKSSSHDTLILFFSTSSSDMELYHGYFEVMLGFYEQTLKNLKSKGGEALLNVSRETTISLMKLQIDQNQFFKFFIALILKTTKAKGAKLLTKDNTLVFEYILDKNAAIQKIFFIRNTPYKLEFYDTNPIKTETISQIGSFLDMAGAFLANIDQNSEMIQNYLQLLKFTNDAVELENIYYKNHSLIVQTVSVEVAKSLFLSENEIDTISLGASLHDIGMIGDLLAVLDKEKLEDKEMNLIKEHPLIGSIIVEPISHIYPISNIIKYHHERFDGKGYPFGLKESQIPIEAQVVSLGEFYAGITGDRSYKKGKTHQEAVQEIKKLENKMFSAVMINAFLDVEQSIKIKVDKIVGRGESDDSGR